MATAIIVLGLIAFGFIGGTILYLTSDTVKVIINSIIDFLITFLNSTPALQNFVTVIGKYLFDFLGFILIHLPFTFMMCQMFFMFYAITCPKTQESQSLKILRIYIGCNIKLWEFIFNIFEKLINVLISIGRMVRG
jgi:ABC-type amino acid transport system permease subunit